MKSNVSHLRARTLIRDSIHDMINFNVFEREIIDSPYFQRLHFVLQNSTTYVAYPTNKNTRFPHSLGVAYLSGHMFSKAVNHASSVDMASFIGEASSFIDRTIAELFRGPFGKTADFLERMNEAWKRTISGQSGFAHAPFLQSEDSVTSTKSSERNAKISPQMVVDTYWQAIRIYGLIHDIGHLPMSHSFEHAVEKTSYLFDLYDNDQSHKKLYERHHKEKEHEFTGAKRINNKNYISFFSNILDIPEKSIKEYIFKLALHERRSLSIFNRILNEGKFFSGEEQCIIEYRELIYILTASIILSRSMYVSGTANSPSVRKYQFLCALKSIVDGEVDTDRIDYTLRDGHSCGSHIGTFDYQRIFENAMLKRDNATGFLHIAFYIRGLTGIEQFFNGRYESYKYLIHHRTSSRTEVCLQELISRLFHYCYVFPENDPLTDLMVYYGYLKRRKKSILSMLPDDNRTLSRIDDANLRTMIFEINEVIYREKRYSSKKYSKYISHIQNLIDIVLFRSYRDIYDPFKNTRIRDRMKDIVGKQNYNEDDFFNFANSILSTEQVKFDMPNKFRREISIATSDRVNAIVTIAKPKLYEVNSEDYREYKKVKIVLPGGDLSDAHEYSETLRNMRARDVHEKYLKVYFVSKDIRSSGNTDREVCDSMVTCFLQDEWNEYQRIKESKS